MERAPLGYRYRATAVDVLQLFFRVYLALSAFPLSFCCLKAISKIEIQTATVHRF
ncbi:hypothetical protein OH687_05040 [Burkholderia anthina]|nr:hypothetical protein OH687_05040 [Burkholderia anthina]